MSKLKNTTTMRALDLGYTFVNEALLEEALTHSSYANEEGLPFCNERLEFLGDAVLELCVSDLIFKSCPGCSEGDMSRTRAALVCTTTLAEWCRRTGIVDNLRLGGGMKSAPSNNIMADAFEAVLGAVYLDGGIDAARAFVARFYSYPAIEAADGVKDPKSRLQEALQGMGFPCPEYKTVSQDGPPHCRTYSVEAWCCKRLMGRGLGKSLRGAQMVAAEEALSKLNTLERVR